MSIKKFENFFSEELYKEVIDTARDLLRRGENIFHTNVVWQNEIVKDSFPVLIHSINSESELYNKLRQHIEQMTGLVVRDRNIMFYYWTRFSYIPWHQDPHCEGALSVYLNEQWHEDYGGYLLYEEGPDDIRAILPKKNLAVLQKGGTRHTTTAVHFSGGMRLTIQVFLEKP